MIRLRPYKACDAQTITSWLKNEYAFRQWSADRYENYPITADDMNLYYDRDRDNARIWGMTAFDDTGIVGHFTMSFRHGNASRCTLASLGACIMSDDIIPCVSPMTAALMKSD